MVAAATEEGETSPSELAAIAQGAHPQSAKEDKKAHKEVSSCKVTCLSFTEHTTICKALVRKVVFKIGNVEQALCKCQKDHAEMHAMRLFTMLQLLIVVKML